jgi:hypothetical protein
MGKELMPEEHKPVRVAANVMRAFLTVIGFNITIVSFQIAQLRSGSVAGGLEVPGLGHTVHVGADMELFMALGLSLIAMMALIMSSEFDEVGVCTHWSLLAGSLLMYMALAHTVAGFFSPLSTTIETVAGKLPDQASDFYILRLGSKITGGAAWFLATYVGPLVTLVRSPFKRRINIALGIAYLLLLLVLSWNTALTVRLESAFSGDEPGLIFSILRELVQPLRW